MRIPFLFKSGGLSTNPPPSNPAPKEAGLSMITIKSAEFSDVYERLSGETIQLTCPKKYQNYIPRYIKDDCNFRASTAMWTPSWQQAYQKSEDDNYFSIESPHTSALNASTLLCIRGAIDHGVQDFHDFNDRMAMQVVFYIVELPFIVAITGAAVCLVGDWIGIALKDISAHIYDRRRQRAFDIERRMRQDLQVRELENERLRLVAAAQNAANRLPAYRATE